MSSRSLVILVLAFGLVGCVPEPPLPTCDVEPYVGTLVGPEARDCGSWDYSDPQAQDAVDCVLDAVDAGAPFQYRLNGVARPDFEEPQWEPYALSHIYVGQLDGGLSRIYFEAPLGGRIELFTCDGFSVDSFSSGGRMQRLLSCNTVSHQRICSYQYEHQQRQQR